MSFVINKAAKKSLFDTLRSQDTPGPGKYNIQQRTVIEIPAPFNSSVPKISSFDMQQFNQQRPGFYNQVDIKQIYQPKTKFPTTSSFASKVQRFKTEPSLASTHFYSSAADFSINTRKKRDKTVEKAKSRMSQLRQQNRQQKRTSIQGKKQFIRVILSNPKNTQSKQEYYIDPQIQSKTSGPGQYQINKPFVKPKHIISWQNSKEQRFKSASTITPGVGCYQLKNQQQKRSNLSSSFAYAGLKSHIDAIIYNTNIPLKKQLLQESGMKSLDPGPGQYQISKKQRRSFNHGDSNFGTKVQRFNQNDKNLSLNQYLGPGSYQIVRDQSFSKRNQHSQTKRLNKTTVIKHRSNQNVNRSGNLIISNQKVALNLKKSHQKNLEARSSAKIIKLGHVKQKRTSKYGNWGQQLRFKSQNKCKSNTKVGPGQYEIMAQPFSQQQMSGSHMFVSKCKRQLIKKQQNRPFYNICNSDIGSRMKKIKVHLDNLRKVAIERVPFASGALRFECPKNSQQSRLQPQENRKIIYKKGLKNETSVVFKSKSERVIFKCEQDNPGPGEYQIQMSHLIKKSFNKNYKQDERDSKAS